MLNNPPNAENSPVKKELDQSPSILTNMAYWQSPVWRNRAASIHADHGRNLTQEPAWWKQAWELFINSSNHDVVLTLGVRESMFYGFLCLLTGRVSRQIMTEVFIDDQAASLAWKIKTWLYRKISRRCMGILTNSTAEIETMSERYALPTGRFRFVPLNSTLANASFSEQDDGYVLSAGRTLRDYPTLLEAVKNRVGKLVIICGRDDQFTDPIPPHVTILREIDFDTYVDYIKRCTLLAIPLKSTGRATGQVVMLDAMAIGKPVIVTRTPGTVDYIRDGKNGVLVEPGDVAGLRDAINSLINDQETRHRLRTQAYRDVQALYTFDTHATLKLKAIHDLYATYGKINTL
jgi:glycosyltransferase involved in cell wall biosynthesis